MKLLSIGELTVDWLSLDNSESVLDSTKFYRYLGGNAANVAVVAANLGLNVRLLGKVGDDIHGEYLLSCLKESSVDLSQLKIDVRYPTAQCYMTKEPDGSPVYRNWPKPNAAQMLVFEEIEESVVSSADLLHCTGISLTVEPRRQAILHAVKLANKHDLIVAYDACFPSGQAEEGKQAALTVMSSADLLKMNVAELTFWSGMPADSDLDAMAAKIHSFAEPIALFVTLAEKGALIYTQTGKVKIEAFPVQSVCDVGAGDAFMAGLYYGLSQKLPALERKKFLQSLALADWQTMAKPACLAGALATLSIGATEKFPGLAEFQKCLSKASLEAI